MIFAYKKLIISYLPHFFNHLIRIELKRIHLNENVIFTGI